MQIQAENSHKNELNFWNGKVMTLKRDLEYATTFSEKMQEENKNLQADVENLSRLMDMKEKTLILAKKEAAGLQEDNERLNRMYQLVQKEAFSNVKMQKQSIQQEEPVYKKGSYQALRNESKTNIGPGMGHQGNTMPQ